VLGNLSVCLTTNFVVAFKTKQKYEDFTVQTTMSKFMTIVLNKRQAIHLSSQFK
jgi:hypothetical protein